MRLDRAVALGFLVHDDCKYRDLAVAALEQAGVKDAWHAELTPHAEAFLCGLANRLAELLWDDDRRIDLPGRARTEAREALHDVDRLHAPSVLYAIAPWTELPRGTIGDLHRACIPKLAEALVPFIGRILAGWCERELLQDISRPVPHRAP